MNIVIGVLLILHGLIVAGQSGGAFKPLDGPICIANPSWISWWPTRLGQSWLLGGLHLERFPFITVGGVLWIIGGIALAAAGLALLGVIVPPGWWRTLAAVGAAISLFMLAIYFHPLSIVGTAASLAVLVALRWGALLPSLP